MKRTVRESVFFILIFLLFFLAVKLARFWIQKMNMNANTAYIIVGLTFTLVMVAVYYLAKLQSSAEGFWDVSDASRCKGGLYMFQGNSPEAKMCREMASTESGKIAISGYNCPTGFIGSPGLPFAYSPLSNDKWQSERCDESIPSCAKVDVGLCSLEKQD